MSSIIRYKDYGLQIVSPEPTGEGGVALNENFKALTENLAEVDPGVDDDALAGYAAGSRWLNTLTGVEWVCVDPTEGAAVWQRPAVQNASTSAASANTPWSIVSRDQYGNFATSMATLAHLQVHPDVVGGSGSDIEIGINAFPNKLWSTDLGGIQLHANGGMVGGLLTELSGAVLSYGINVPQTGGRNNAFTGGLFRLDTRADAPYFSVWRYAAGGDTPVNDLSINAEGVVNIANLWVTGQTYVNNSITSQGPGGGLAAMARNGGGHFFMWYTPDNASHKLYSGATSKDVLTVGSNGDVTASGLLTITGATNNTKGFRLLNDAGHDWRIYADEPSIGLVIGGAAGYFWKAQYWSNPANEFRSPSGSNQCIVRAVGSATHTGNLFEGWKDTNNTSLITSDGAAVFGSSVTATAISISGAGTVGGSLHAGRAFTAGRQSVPYAASTTIDPSQGNTFDMTLTGNLTLSVGNGVQDGQNIRLRLKQDSTGGRTLAWGGSNIRFGSSVTSTTLTAAAGKKDVVSLLWDETDAKWDVVGFEAGF